MLTYIRSFISQGSQPSANGNGDLDLRTARSLIFLVSFRVPHMGLVALRGADLPTCRLVLAQQDSHSLEEDNNE